MVRSFVIGLVLGAALPACGGTVGDGDTRTGGTVPPGSGGSGGRATADGGLPRGGASGASADAGDGSIPYRDPSCPPVGPSAPTYACDPVTLTGCGSGERCIPFVEYADHCGTEQSGTMCAPEGTGVQGDDCSVVDCAAGYVCASGGVGLECAKLCRPSGGADGCAPGLVCVALDVDGFYVCG